MQRAITENYFSQVKLIRQTIFTLIGQAFAFTKNPSLNTEKLRLNIKQKHLYTIEADRKLAVYNGGGGGLDFSYIPASIDHAEGTSDAKVRLKGDNLEQFSNKRLSFRVKMRDDKRFKGMSVFSAHHAKHRNWLYEWVYLEVLRREGIIAPRYYFGELVLNGENLGLYAFEEHFSNELIEHNARREGAIIRLDENLDIPFLAAISGQGDSATLPIHLQWPHYLTKYAERNSFSMLKSEKTNKSSLLYRNCSKKLQSYLDGKEDFSNIFDSEKVAKHVAISMVFGATHGLDINNQRFYCNSVTGKLEPIGFDGNAGSKILSTKEILLRLETAAGNSPDKEYMEHLVDALYNYTDPSFLESLMGDEAFVSSMDKNLLTVVGGFFIDGREQIATYRDYLSSVNNKEFVGSAIIQKNSETIHSFLNTQGSVITTVTGAFGSYLNLQLRNVHPLPILVDAILFDGKNILADGFILDGLNLFSLKSNGEGNRRKLEIRIEDKTKFESLKRDLADVTALSNGRLQIKYRMNGAPEEETVTKKRFIVEKSLPTTHNFQSYLDIRQAQLANITINESEKIIQQRGAVRIAQSIKIPPGYTYQISPGSKVTLYNGAFIYSESAINATGTSKNPVIFEGGDTIGGGILVAGSDDQSWFQNVEFKSLGNLKPEESGGLLITSALTFYETDVGFKNTSFTNNLNGDDLLNIFRSKFVLHKSKFHNSHADALDVDFSSGLISETTFTNCGVRLRSDQSENTIINSAQPLNGDCLDFSGSRVKLQDLTINGAGDKGISVGEASEIHANNIAVKNVRYGVVSKDQSVLSVQNLALHNATIGLASYKKKSEFGPGSIVAQVSEASGVITMSLAEHGSLIEAVDNQGASLQTKYSTYPFVIN